VGEKGKKLGGTRNITKGGKGKKGGLLSSVRVGIGAKGRRVKGYVEVKELVRIKVPQVLGGGLSTRGSYYFYDKKRIRALQTGRSERIRERIIPNATLIGLKKKNPLGPSLQAEGEWGDH